MIIIEKIKIVEKVDENPDWSHYGTFSDEPGQFAIPWNQRGIGKCKKFFNADNVASLEEANENFRRMQMVDSGDIVCCGIYATASIRVNGIGQVIRSGGLWGIESDSSVNSKREVAEEQLAELFELLQTIGATKEQLKEIGYTKFAKIQIRTPYRREDDKIGASINMQNSSLHCRKKITSESLEVKPAEFEVEHEK